ncbi:MAG: hypothetical protein KC431_14625, partial [Myxococcales bacterium]|nr:hypothetical protein [Myxococcales bacterium]
RRVLICGFRSGTVSMVEALIKSEPQAQILIMVNDQRAREAAWDDFDAHSKLIQRGLLQGHHGAFRADKSHWALTWIDPEHPRRVADHPHVHLVTGDWSSSRRLTALPLGFGHVETMNAVVLISSEHTGADARTAKTLMKLETLTRAPRVVAEVLDVELARRLRRRATVRGQERMQVYSIQELRAFFMFQSVVVPYFDLVYAELMGPWGESFVQLVPMPAESPANSMTGVVGKCSFEELANHLSANGQVLAAVELYDDPMPQRPACEAPGGAGECDKSCKKCWPTTLHVASGDPEDGDRIDLGRLAGVWVIARDDQHGFCQAP